MAYVIFRVDKIKADTLSKSTNHVDRTDGKRPDNADPLKQNKTIFGSGDSKADINAVLPQKIRSNAVLAMDFVLTASPEYFRPKNPEAAGTYEQDRLDAFVKEGTEWLKKEFGKNLVSVQLHLDESTPHMQGYVVPLRADGKLDAAKLFNPDRLEQLQDSAGTAFEKIGLERGLKSSTAKHIDIKQYYAVVNKKPITALTTIPPQPEKPNMLMSRMSFGLIKPKGFNEYERLKSIRDAAIKKKQSETFKINQQNEAKARQIEIVKASYNERISAPKPDLALVRDIDLKDTMAMLGATVDSKDKNNFNCEIGRITINDDRFYCHDIEMGGGGSIDLVMAVRSCDFKEAVRVLSQSFGINKAESAVFQRAKLVIQNTVKEKPRSTIPVHIPENVEKVKAWISKRGISPGTFNKAMAQNIISVDDRNNIFYLNSNKNGGEIRGQGANFKGYRGHRGLFQFKTADVKKVLVVESGTDALAAAECGFEGLIVSTGGDWSNKALEALKSLAVTHKMLIGTDTDDAGEKKAKKLLAALPSSERYAPHGRDWQAQLSSIDVSKLLEENALKESESLKQVKNNKNLIDDATVIKNNNIRPSM